MRNDTKGADGRPLISYRLGAVKKTKNDYYYVEFYAYDPDKDSLSRERKYVPKYNTIKERKKHAEQVKEKINRDLIDGWDPFTQKAGKNQYITVVNALEKALAIKQGNGLRSKTLSSYKSAVNDFIKYLHQERKENELISNLTKPFALEYLDNWKIKLIESSKESSIPPSTVNNRVANLRAIFTLLCERGYMSKNPFEGISKVKGRTTRKRPFTSKELNTYTAYIKENDNSLYVASALCYYTALRPSEIVNLKKKSFKDLKSNILFMDGGVTKNKNDAYQSVPKQLKKILKPYLSLINDDECYLFSSGLRPGMKKIQPTRISERFGEVKKILGFDKEVQFYGLKDTSADILMANNISSKEIRDHFRHSSIKTTDLYLKSINPEGVANKIIVENFPKGSFQ